MKLSKTQILILALLFLYHFNKPSKVFTPDLSAAEFESRTIAGLNVMLSESPFEETEPTVESVLNEETELQQDPQPQQEPVVEKKKRLILLTDPINCGPCRSLESLVISRLSADEGKKLGWTVGTDESKMLQVIDRNKAGQQFSEYINKISTIKKTGVGIPLMFVIDEEGNIDESTINMGSMTMLEFSRYYNGIFIKNDN